jgi:hypothetical protein
MGEDVVEVHIKEGDDPRFERAVELANEVVSSLVFWVLEPVDERSYALPTLSMVVNELANDHDPSLLAMFVFALGRYARNLTSALAVERGRTSAAVLEEFLFRPGSVS